MTNGSINNSSSHISACSCRSNSYNAILVFIIEFIYTTISFVYSLKSKLGLKYKSMYTCQRQVFTEQVIKGSQQILVGEQEEKGIQLSFHE